MVARIENASQEDKPRIVAGVVHLPQGVQRAALGLGRINRSDIQEDERLRREVWVARLRHRSFGRISDVRLAGQVRGGGEGLTSL